MCKLVACSSILIFSFLFGNLAHACKCAGPSNRDEAFKQASKVFLGTVRGKSQYDQKRNYELVYFEVEKSWKGVTGIKAQIKVGSTLQCGYNFEMNKKYLVFATDNPPAYVPHCGWTKLAESAAVDVAGLGKSIPLK